MDTGPRRWLCVLLAPHSILQTTSPSSVYSPTPASLTPTAFDRMPSTITSLGELSTAPIYGRLCTWLAFASNTKHAHRDLQLLQESRDRPFTAQVSQVFGLLSSDDLALCSSSITPSHGHARPFTNYSSSQGCRSLTTTSCLPDNSLLWPRLSNFLVRTSPADCSIGAIPSSSMPFLPFLPLFQSLPCRNSQLPSLPPAY